MYGCVFDEDMALVQQLYFTLLESQLERAFGRPPVAAIPMCREVLLLVGAIGPGETEINKREEE
jgi:hypothetical protein